MRWDEVLEECGSTTGSFTSLGGASVNQRGVAPPRRAAESWSSLGRMEMLRTVLK